jgi:hypothetical protein
VAGIKYVPSALKKASKSGFGSIYKSSTYMIYFISNENLHGNILYKQSILAVFTDTMTVIDTMFNFGRI